MADEVQATTNVEANGSASLKSRTTDPPSHEHIQPSSDGEDERSTRERLKKTSIANLPQKLGEESISAASAETSNGGRGRPAKKRSFEDLAQDEADATSGHAEGQEPLSKKSTHKRMRSRDVESGEHAATVETIDDLANNATVQEESGFDAQKSPGGPGVLVDAPSQEEMDKDESMRQSQTEDTAAPLPSTTDESASKIPRSSGFANASTASPFSAARSKSPEVSNSSTNPATSSSAFASSGLSAFASSSSSPFGSTGTKPAGGFGSGPSAFGGPSTGFSNSSTTGAFGSSKAFGGTSTSAFGSTKTSTFGSTSASSHPFGKPSPFAGGSGSAFGSGKPFGSQAKSDDDDEDAGDGDNDNDTTASDNHVQDPRFHEQQVDTGEEGEETYFTCRAKLYHFEKEWKERGTGVVKINTRYSDEPLNHSRNDSEQDLEAGSGFTSTKRKARLLMRADGVHRVVLNSPIFKGMKFGASDGSAPVGRIMHFQGVEDGKSRPYQIKVGKEETMKELYHKMMELEQEAT